MDVKTFIFTSKPIFDKNADNYDDIISDIIQKGIRKNDSSATIKCATCIENHIIFIYIEIVADASIGAFTIVRRKLNKLFKDTSLFPSAALLSQSNR